MDKINRGRVVLLIMRQASIYRSRFHLQEAKTKGRKPHRECWGCGGCPHSISHKAKAGQGINETNFGLVEYGAFHCQPSRGRVCVCAIRLWLGSKPLAHHI